MSAGAAVELQAFLRATAAGGRTVVPVPPFTAYLHPADPLRFLNYAIPDGEVEPARAQVAALRAAFRSRERLPRLEWVEEAAPRMEPHAADEPAATFARPAGGGAVLARAGGTPVAVAVWTRVVDGCSEVAGVATAERWRRRGLAGMVTAAAARAAFLAGARLCVLSPGDDAAQRVYARAGFRRAATMLHWADPAD